MEPFKEEHIVLTPKKKTQRSTTLIMERKQVPLESSTGNIHVAGGSNAGIIVNKQQIGDKEDDLKLIPPHLCLEFRVFLINLSTKRYTQEKRLITYWFKEQFSKNERAGEAQEFFKKLVSPINFPRDYVGFIKKIMKLMQNDYPMIAKIEVELTQEKEMDQLPNRPTRAGALLYSVGKDGLLWTYKGEEEKKSEDKTLTSEQILSAIEESYPNSLTLDDMSRRFKSETTIVRHLVVELVTKNLVKPVGAGLLEIEDVDPASVAFRRVHNQGDDNVTVVKQMPRGSGSGGHGLHPTIAVITAHYFEKVAVDAVMSNKQTFVRYATVGEANVYTLGDLGKHRVVTTKLPMTGNTRDALIATGSTTTRLLGTFQDVEHVFIVGVAGAVPHFTDFDKHVRLGDVVLSAPSKHGQRFIYSYCESVKETSTGGLQFETRSWCPVDLGLQSIAEALVEKHQIDHSMGGPWKKYFEEALDQITGGQEQEKELWTRPAQETDKLYMSVGESELIEVGHPTPNRPDDVDPRLRGDPVLHLGPVAAGRQVALDDQLRQEFSLRHSNIAFDTELDTVVDSIYGNRKDQYMLIKGIADYKDGTRRKDWQQYAALMAAAVLRTVVESMPPPPSHTH